VAPEIFTAVFISKAPAPSSIACAREKPEIEFFQAMTR